MTCMGDSGAPGLLEQDGHEVVAGLVSYGDMNCQSSAGLSRVDTVAAEIAGWIAQAEGGSDGGTGSTGSDAGTGGGAPDAGAGGATGGVDGGSGGGTSGGTGGGSSSGCGSAAGGALALLVLGAAAALRGRRRARPA
jgi:secreted trypsin-like serine protease